MTQEQFTQDEKTVDAVVRNFTVIGEAANNVPEDIQLKYPQVPWADIIGMRNFFVHEYFGVSNEVLWTTIQEDLPALVPLLGALLKKTSSI